jgi:hypothetical protein
MTARTALVPQALARDSGVALTFDAVDSANGNVVAAGPFKVVLIVDNANASSTQTVTIRATGNGVTQAGATATGDPDFIFTQASRGDNVITLTHSAYTVIPLFDTDRITQLDGTLSLDWSTSTSITCAVVQYPSASLGT